LSCFNRAAHSSATTVLLRISRRWPDVRQLHYSAIGKQKGYGNPLLQIDQFHFDRISWRLA
jgi:hypothetical protein